MKKYASNSLQKISSYNIISDKRTSDKQRSKNNLRNSLDFFLTHRDKKGFLRSSEGFQVRLVLRQLIFSVDFLPSLESDESGNGGRSIKTDKARPKHWKTERER